MAYSTPLVSLNQSSTDSDGFTTAAINTTGCDILIAVVTEISATPTTLADSKTNTWTPLTRYVNSNGIRIFYSKNPTVGSGHTFTPSGPSSNSYVAIAVAGFSGSDLSAPADKDNGNSSASATNLGTNSITPAVDNELIIAGWGTDSVAGIVFAVTNGFTIVGTPSDGGSTNESCMMAYKIQTTLAAISTTCSEAPSACGMSTAIASFKSAGAGGDTLFAGSVM